MIFSEKIFKEQFNLLQPYFYEWYKLKSKKISESEFEFIKLEDSTNSIDILSLDACEKIIVFENFNSIKSAFYNIIKKYYLSISANEVIKEISRTKKLEESWINFWKFEIRNFYANDLIPDIYRILEYISYFVNYLSKHNFIKYDKDVSFRKINSILQDEKKEKIAEESIKNTYLNKDDIFLLKKLFSDAENIFYSNDNKEVLSDTNIRDLKNLRNIGEHRYYIGINEGINITEKTKEGYRMNTQNFIKYEEYIKESYRLIKEMDKILMNFLKISSVKKMNIKNI